MKTIAKKRNNSTNKREKGVSRKKTKKDQLKFLANFFR